MSYKTALITGASSGLGRGLALALGKRGTHVVAAARRKVELDSLVTEIMASGGSAEALVLDCSQADATHDTIRSLDRKLSFDLVIANAGIGGPTPAQNINWPHVKRVLELNVLGACATLSAALPGMVDRNAGHLVTMASLAGYNGLPTWAAYTASKAAMIAFAESLRIDLYGSGVSVTTICPGYVETELTAKHQGKMPFIMKLDDAVPIMLKAIDRRKPLCAFPKTMSAIARSGQIIPRGLYRWSVRKSKLAT